MPVGMLWHLWLMWGRLEGSVKQGSRGTAGWGLWVARARSRRMSKDEDMHCDDDAGKSK